MFDRILIANRGEIAVRIARTCHDLGISVATVFSDADEGALHVEVADEAVHLTGRAPAETYLDYAALLDAAMRTGAEAVHPGYGFLAEDAGFARAVIEAGLVWVGPPPEALVLAGSKLAARRTALEAGVPLVPGLTEPADDPGVIATFGEKHGYPIAIKAAGGGGGRGLKVARSEAEVRDAFEAARREAKTYFGPDDVYVERYLEDAKHMEVQILALEPARPLWLGVRDCSLQRRHQKLIEETPPPLYGELVNDMGAAALALSRACGYVNAGTAEFLVQDGAFYFLELNARLQVEHCVTEETYGVDLVACQLRIAAGEDTGLVQDDLVPGGHAIECRIIAEDPALDFAPSPGVITRYSEPSGPGVRVDAGYRQGDEIPPDYDSLVAKLITHGKDRAEARNRMLEALRSYVIEGPATSISAHLLLLEESSFVLGTHSTRTVERDGVLASLTGSAGEGSQNVLWVGDKAVRLWHPAMAPFAAAAATASAGGSVTAPMQGTILQILVEPGRRVRAGDGLMVVESMKMETTIPAPSPGRVAAVPVAVGDGVRGGQVLVTIESE